MTRHSGRRWLQFGMGTALVVMTVVAAVVACFAHVANIRRDAVLQQLAVHEIANLRGSLYFDCQRTAEGRWLEEVPLVERSWMSGWLPEEHFRKIVWINLAATSTGDGDLEFLPGAPNIEVLYLNHTQITDRGLPRLRALRDLRELCLNGTAVTDAGMVELESLELLEALDLEHTAVGDIGLAHLHRLRNLRSLLLRDTKVSLEGIRQAQMALPECRIVFEQ